MRVESVKKTEPARRYSIYLSDSQVEFINEAVCQRGLKIDLSRPVVAIMSLLKSIGMPERYVVPPSSRGQGRKKTKVKSVKSGLKSFVNSTARSDSHLDFSPDGIPKLSEDNSTLRDPLSSSLHSEMSFPKNASLTLKHDS